MGRSIQFSEKELVSIRECTRWLGITYEEFIMQATLDAAEECESTLNDHHRRPLTNGKLREMMEELEARGADPEYCVAWLRRQAERMSART